MDIGIYNAKYPFRKLIQFLLPYFKNTDPNTVSYALVPLGLLTALIYFFAPKCDWLYLLGIVLIFLRMIVGTLDGLIAETFHKQSPKGEVNNRLTPECADILLMLAIALSLPASLPLGLFALGISWGISYTGIIGAVAGLKPQSVGPVGQTDRIASLILLSLLQFFSLHYAWNFNFIILFLWWVIIGGLITIGLRIYRLFKLLSPQ
ncbi:MAG TPA: hypothetical protein VHE99_01045 [Gammaproteobacteria bacterium]|nr:hypothetical protein [Gammaproteobacteria bacterium]